MVICDNVEFFFMKIRKNDNKYKIGPWVLDHENIQRKRKHP